MPKTEIVDCLVHFAKSHPLGWGIPLPQKSNTTGEVMPFWVQANAAPQTETDAEVSPLLTLQKKYLIHRSSLPSDKQVFVFSSATVNRRQCGLPKPRINNYARRYTTQTCNSDKDSTCRRLLLFLSEQTWKKNLKLKLKLRIKLKWTWGFATPNNYRSHFSWWKTGCDVSKFRVPLKV